MEESEQVGGEVGGTAEARGRSIFDRASEIEGGGGEKERGLHACQVISPLAAFRHVSL